MFGENFRHMFVYCYLRAWLFMCAHVWRKFEAVRYWDDWSHELSAAADSSASFLDPIISEIWTLPCSKIWTHRSVKIEPHQWKLNPAISEIWTPPKIWTIQGNLNPAAKIEPYKWNQGSAPLPFDCSPDNNQQMKTNTKTQYYLWSEGACMPIYMCFSS